MTKVKEHDISIKVTLKDNWVAKAKYGSKKENKLWINVHLINRNSFNEKTGLYDYINSCVLFINGTLVEINWIEYNGKVVKDTNRVDSEIIQMILSVAKIKSEEYL